MAESLQLFQRNCGFYREGTDFESSQLRDMAESIEGECQIPHPGPDIRALAAGKLENRLVRVQNFDQPGFSDKNRTRLQAELLAVARKVIGPLTVHLYGRIGRRHLEDFPNETRELGEDLGLAWANLGERRNLAFGIVCGARLAPAGGEAVELFAVHGVGHRLGRLAQSDG